ncbi:histidine phosphatase family protein [Leifsonia sp. PS1209]|uniref:histidine phosphatase family protein n=1 Tax=Leifsonia sp. PS1209 TaxID=2724914 RepID=UPI001442B32B|nr:histidine phosphatase family protein [Leifsonia sp. PS1209]QIZ99833.1 histidine phosphatase family protein [Leifsonia sp. PS1209]
MSQQENGQQLYLVRHGQTAFNAEGRLRGLANPPLDETGRAEAAALGQYLQNKGVVAAFSSPLTRAVTTAQAIADAAGVDSYADDRFNDRDYGPWTGHIKADVIAEFGSVDAAPGVEPVSQVMARARPALDAVLDQYPEGAVVVVTHDAVIRPLLTELDPEVGPVAAPTGSVNELLRLDGAWRIQVVDLVPSTMTG